MALLEIENLSVKFPSKNAVMHAVDGVSLSVDAGDVLGIVGESGSGKSVTMMALMGLVSFPGVVTADKLGEPAVAPDIKMGRDLHFKNCRKIPVHRGIEPIEEKILNPVATELVWRQADVVDDDE